MPQIIVTEPFKWSPDGIHVIEYTPGVDSIDVPERCAQVATGNGWAEPATGGSTPTRRQPRGAPK